MQIENLAISDIKPYENNARTHPKKQIKLIADNIKRFSFTTPCLVDKDNNLIAGHGRIEAVKLLDWSEVPVVRMENLTEEEVKALRLADNKLAEMSEWDMGLVTDELKELDDDLLDLTGFDKDLVIEPEEKDDDVPEVPEEPKSKLGDLYQLGEHRVLCGDSTDIDNVEKLMNEKKADMVFTDPPYGMGFDIKNDRVDEFEAIFTGTVVHWIENTKKENWYICGNFRCLSFFENVLKAHGIKLYEKIVWIKNLYGQGKLYNRMHEDILFAGSGSFYKVDKDVDVWKEDSVRNFGGSENAHEAVGHPTQKPVNLVARAIKNSSKNEDIVLDSFLGSGSTLIAAEKTGRICYGMELDPKYVDVIVQRYVDYVDDPVVLCNGEDVSHLWDKTVKKAEKSERQT